MFSQYLPDVKAFHTRSIGVVIVSSVVELPCANNLTHFAVHGILRPFQVRWELDLTVTGSILPGTEVDHISGDYRTFTHRTEIA